MARIDCQNFPYLVLENSPEKLSSRAGWALLLCQPDYEVAGKITHPLCENLTGDGAAAEFGSLSLLSSVRRSQVMLGAFWISRRDQHKTQQERVLRGHRCGRASTCQLGTQESNGIVILTRL